MIVLGSWDSAAFAEPRALEVVRVVRGPGGWCATEYAVGRVVHPSAGTEWVAVRLRGSRRWRPGHSESEAVGRRDLDGTPHHCQTLGAEGEWHDSEHLERHHLLGSNDADLTDVSEAVVHHLLAQARAAGRFTRS